MRYELIKLNNIFPVGKYLNLNCFLEYISKLIGNFMKTSLNTHNINQQQTIPEANKQVYFKASSQGSDSAEFSNKQSKQSVITIASVGAAIATTIALVKSKMQLSKIEKQLAGNLKDMGFEFVAKGKSTFSRITQMAERFFSLSAKDTLTGLYNRRYLYANLPEIVKKARLKGEGINKAMIDLDYFKSVNTAFEHKGGDEYLKRISTIIKDIFKEEGELVARYGGEEITIVTKNPEKLQKLADSIKNDEELLKRKDEYLKKFDQLINDSETSEADSLLYRKYINHVEKNGFTTSIGHVDIKDYPELDSEDYIQLADKSLEILKKANRRGEIQYPGYLEAIETYKEKIKNLEKQNSIKPKPENEAIIDELKKKVNHLQSQLDSY
jgi:diguanylate cyclase (GGDEF)-like protein